MKIRRRALSLLLSLAIVITFIPALAFADNGEGNDRGNPTSLEIVPSGSYTASCDYEEDGYYDEDEKWIKTSDSYLYYYEPYFNDGDKAIIKYEKLPDPITYTAVIDETGTVRFVNGDESIVLGRQWVNDQSYNAQFMAGSTESFRAYCSVWTDEDDEEQLLYSNELSAYLNSYEGNEFSGNIVISGTISSGETKNVSIGNPYDYASFEFRPEVSGTYCFRSNGSIDPCGRILDSDGKQLLRDDDYDEGVYNFAINFTAEEGKVYYLQACLLENGTGTFSVELLSGENEALDPTERTTIDGITYHRIEGTSEALIWTASEDLSGTVVIPSSVMLENGVMCRVTVIDYSAFEDCTNVTAVVIPGTVTEIRNDAFLNTGIKEVNIPASVKVIGEHAFGYSSTSAPDKPGRQYTKAPDFIIDAPAGSAGAQYAAANGITKVDRSAEKAAAEAAAAKAAAEKAAAEAAAAKAAEEKAAAEAAAAKAAEEKAAAEAAAAEAKAKSVKTVTINASTVSAAAIDKAVKAKGGSQKYVTKIVLGKKVRKISKKAFSKYPKVTTIELRTTKLKAKAVKNSLKGSKVKTVKIKVGSKAQNKTYIKKYKKIFTQANAGKKVVVK